MGFSEDDYVQNEESSVDMIVVSFEPDDKQNPHNFKTGKRVYIVFTAILACLNSSMGSALTANLIPDLQKTFGVPSGPQIVLPASVFLLGFVFGPLIFAPLSESYGRKPIMVFGATFFALATLACPLAPNWASFLIFRFLAGMFGSPPMSVMGGMIADVFADKVARGRMLTFWSAATFIGPLAAPIIAGFTSSHGWKWAFWIALIIAVVSLIPIYLLPETLASKLLTLKAAELNKKNNCQKYIGPADLQQQSVGDFLRTTLTRPLYLFTHEMILFLSCVYMAFVYAVFYMLLVFFNTIFQGVYGMSPGIAGVAFTMMGLGTICACLVFIWYDRQAPRLTAKYPNKHAEVLRLPCACVGGPFFVIALLWLGWASKAEIPWIVPLLATIPYGFAYQMIFMAMINYIADAYGIYAASALAACGATRSICGALIPLGVDNLVDALGIAWSCTLLSLISAVLCVVPWCFIAWGERIRAASRFSSQLQPRAELALTRTISAV